MRKRGLLRELNRGPLAPEARIMPLDQAPDADGQCVCVLASLMCNERRRIATLASQSVRGGKLRQLACIMMQHEAPPRTEYEKKREASARQAPNQTQYGGMVATPL